MERILSAKVIEEVLEARLPVTSKYQKCSFILPDGKYYVLTEHYEAYRFLVMMEYVSCIPDAEQLLAELGFIRYSWIGYLTLTEKEPTKEQYESLEEVLIYMSRSRDVVSVQLQVDPKFYMNFPLDDIPNIIRKIKLYYKTGKLLP